MSSSPPISQCDANDLVQAVAFKKTQARKDGKHTELRFPFLNLPAELRNNIYKLVLLEKSPIKFGRPFGSQQRFPKTPKLLQVCSRIRNEAMGMWLEGNEFAVTVWNCDARLL